MLKYRRCHATLLVWVQGDESSVVVNNRRIFHGVRELLLAGTVPLEKHRAIKVRSLLGHGPSWLCVVGIPGKLLPLLQVHPVERSSRHHTVNIRHQARISCIAPWQGFSET